MRRRWGGTMSTIPAVLLLALLTAGTCDGTRRTAQRRKDISRTPLLYTPAPSAESLQALAQAMGAAGFEHHTEGRTLVKRLIPSNEQPDDLVEHQGVIGKAGVDFPAFPNIPNTGFNCKNVPTGYYADLETDCQVFHICDTSRKISFLCPNGTIFSQSHLICDWWFKVDCASAPALYESSAEYYSNEQKKTHKVSQSLSKNPDLQQIGADSNIRTESRRAPVNIPSTTEKLLRHRQRLNNDTPLQNAKATSRSFQALFNDNFNPTQRTQATTAFEKRRKNLVQLIANNFGNIPSRTTQPTYPESSTHKTTPTFEYNNIREMQVAAETASFANNNNRQYLQDFNNKNYRPYPVYNPNLTAKPNKPKSNPTLTTLYDIRDKHTNRVTNDFVTTKRPTLVPYTKSYTTIGSEKHEPYTRPGVSLLKEFLEKEKNKTLTTTTEKPVESTTRYVNDNDKIDNPIEKKVTIETKNSFESVTKIPQIIKSIKQLTETAPSDRLDVFPTSKFVTVTTEPTYQERRERLMRKLNLDTFGPTIPTTATEKFYGDLPNRPGLVVPPSLTPKTLHTLAIYYATALDNLSTNLPSDEIDATTTSSFDEYETIDDSLPPLFTRHTINKYTDLFNQEGNSELLEEIKFEPNGTYNELADDLTVQQSQNPLATSPQIRELAQVFTHALSAYLQDPVQFRKVLSDIRPTQPSFGEMLTTTEESYNTEPTTTINEDDDEILGFSDDNKIRPALTSLREGKALGVNTEYTTTSDELTTTSRPFTTEAVTSARFSSQRNPFRCCGRISASYTSPSTPKELFSTPIPYTNTDAVKINSLVTNYSEGIVTTTERHRVPKVAGFQNNSISNTVYGKGVEGDAKPLTEYIEVTNLPTAWGIDISDSTSIPITNSDVNVFESKKIKPTTLLPTTTPVYFTETDSIELENEEELQRAHSQSFVTPQSNSIRQGKQLNIEETKTTIKKPSEELEAPTIPDIETTIQTTTTTSPTIKLEDSEALTTTSSISSIFTSPDTEKTTNQFPWSSTFTNWHSTIIDPITLNDGLSQTGPDHDVSNLEKRTDAWGTITATTPTIENKAITEQSFASSVTVQSTTPGNKNNERIGRLLKDTTSTEPAQDLTTITDTVVEKAKEIMGGMNATTAEKLMNVMKKTKSKTVRRLILLLVQTCDDDHNTTAEASKKALLEALMAVSQKDMDEIVREENATDIPIENDFEVQRIDTVRRMDRMETQERRHEKRGKSLDFDAKAINSLSNPSTTEKTTDFVTETLKTTTNRRGVKKFITRTTPVDNKATRTPFIDSPKAEARVAPQGTDVKTASDTRALELLRSLYTIAARWG